MQRVADDLLSSVMVGKRQIIGRGAMRLWRKGQLCQKAHYMRVENFEMDRYAIDLEIRMYFVWFDQCTGFRAVLVSASI